MAPVSARSVVMKRRMRIFAAAIVIVLARFVITGQVAGQVKDFKPVTDAALLHPDPGDWPNWRRTLDGWGYSPLTQIDTRNVKHLQLAWSWGLKPGLRQPNPLVANGMIYVPSPGGGVQTLDAATGDLLWEFSPKTAGGDPMRPSVMR